MATKKLFAIEIENGIIFSVSLYNGHQRVDIRRYNDGFPTKQGVSLSVDAWNKLLAVAPTIKACLEQVKQGLQASVEIELLDEYFITVKSPYWVVDIRRKFTDNNGTQHYTKTGVRLHIGGWERVLELDKKAKEVIASHEC